MEKEFTVLVPELHHAHRVVKAKTVEEAIQKAKDGQGNDVFCEYIRTLDDDSLWSTEETQGEDL